MIKAHQKWVRRLTLSGIVLIFGISVGFVPLQAIVKQQGNPQSLSLNEIKTNSKLVKVYMKKTSLVMAKNRLSQEKLDQTENRKIEDKETEDQQKSSQDKQSSTEVHPTKVEKQVIAESNPVVVATSEPKTSSQVSRGSSEVDNLIKRALSLQGIPYLWGGTTRDGFDCSGYVQYVFKASGVSLPRTSSEQYNVGTPVSRDQLKPGDLVFFSTYQAGASDVRIYIGGGHTIGSASDGVAIHSLIESYWSKHYLGARRVL